MRLILLALLIFLAVAPERVQFEAGFLPAFDSPEFASRYSFNEVMKISVAPRLEFLVAAEPVAHFTADRATANRVADIFLGAQGVLYRGKGAKPTLAVSYFHRVYDGGAPEFDFGSPTNSILILASADVAFITPTLFSRNWCTDRCAGRSSASS